MVRLFRDKAGHNTSINECYGASDMINRATERRERGMLTFVDRRPGLGMTRFVYGTSVNDFYNACLPRASIVGVL